MRELLESESAELDDNLYNWSRNSWEHGKHPILNLLLFEAVVLLSIGLGVWGMVVDATQMLELDGVMFFLGPSIIIIFLAANIYFFMEIRKYGLYYQFRMRRVFGDKTSLYNPIREEGVLLIKLRDPRVSMRQKYLMEILNLGKGELELGEIHQDIYVKRLSYCLIDKNHKIRRITCEVLHKHFYEYLPTIANLLQDGLDLDFYLVDRSLINRIKEEPFQNIRFCGDLKCFASDEPCQSWPVSQTILSELNSHDFSSSPITSCTSFQTEAITSLNEGQVIGICRVCNLPLYNLADVEKCPNCAHLMHKTHFLEWLKIKGYCPNCRTRVILR